ncbi:MAG: hypothetical protein LQ338_004309 [Usnochroma carphineum]|nr:MAG: hypothetical protein LQ338_004309 [Usnochroma carphineum]
MSLRNELRRSSDWKQFIFYNWGFWYDNMTAGAAAIYKANPDLLIFFSGENYDSRLRPIFSGGSMGVNRTFNKSGFDYADKIVLEVHDYDMDSNCTTKTSKLTENAFAALDKSDPAVEDLYPVVMSEWGYAQSLDQYTAQYASCLRQILPRKYIGWMTWALAGSYYVRSGTQDMDEPWGLLDHEWKDWRCPTCVTQGLGPMAAASLGGGKVVDARTF